MNIRLDYKGGVITHTIALTWDHNLGLSQPDLRPVLFPDTLYETIGDGFSPIGLSKMLGRWFASVPFR